MTKTKDRRTTALRRYKLEISERQAELISRAVELYARLGTGQFDTLERFFWEKLEQARPHLEALRLIQNGSLNSYPGILQDSVNDDYRILYDLHQVVRHRLAWDSDPQPVGTKGVFYDTPMRSSKKEPLAKFYQSESGEYSAPVQQPKGRQ